MKIKRCFRRKLVSELVREAEASKELVRSLGAVQLVMLGIGAIIGAGIFVLTGSAASQHAGPAIVISFALSGAACICAALCYAELASMIPVSGSAYTYMYVTLGELAACVMAGFMVIGSGLSVASVANGWSGYTTSLLSDIGVHLPAQFINTTGEIITLADGTTTTAVADLPALFIVILMTMVLYRGIKASAIVNTIIVCLKMSVLFGFIVLGAFYVELGNLQPFIPENTGQFGEYGLSGIIAGASMVFLAYNGFDTVATAAQEARNPQRDLPIALLGSLVVSTICYILVSGVLVGIAHYSKLGVAQPVAIAVDKMNMPWFASVVKVGAITGLTSVVLVMLYSVVRVLFVMAKDGLLPQILTKCHARFRMPNILTVLCGVVIAIFSATMHLDKLVKLANFGILGTFTIVCFTALYLRYSQPKLKRIFKCPFMPVTPIVGMILLLGIIGGLPVEIYLYALIWIIAIVLYYFLYGCNNSKLQSSL